ncbi:MAG: phenylalanine--tRNA ligase subunit alpha, partial [Candidatus Omnitrophica bacterium]|nr:phenylalanine--tRNA ligase subunit alpha [Candidatus Omnitrophota bacterium]
MGAAEKLEEIRNSFLGKIETCTDARSLEEIKIEFLGRKSELNDILKTLGSLTADEKRIVGKRANDIKNEIALKIGEASSNIEGALLEKRSESVDVTLPGIKPSLGRVHPLTLTMSRINEIFLSMGF